MTFSQRIIRVRQAPDVYKDPEVLAAEIVDLHGTKEERPIGPPRASSIFDACMRMHVLGAKYDKTVVKWTSFKDKLMFGIGNSVHFWIQNSGDVLGAKRRGWWECQACGATRFGAPPTMRCQCKARASAFLYKEHYFQIETKDLTFSGHPDMFLEAVPKIFRTVEVKTLNGDDFQKLKAPHADHEWQLHTYFLGAKHDKTLPVTVDDTAGYVLYVSKKNFGNSFPMKMFLVKKNQTIYTMVKDKISLYTEGVKSFPKRLPPPASDCTKANFTCYRAKSCPVREECWSHKK